MKHGIKRWITRYLRVHQRCRSCGNAFYERDPRWPTSKYGHDLANYTVYQNIELRLSQGRVASSVGQLFDLHISRNATNQFKAAIAQKYAGTYDDLLKRLCRGSLLHVDETSASVMGKDSYVWVLTSMDEVAYFHSPTREGSTIQTMLRNFSGVLVSDFYAVYDAIECPQQKCLIHFIRDLNEELLKHPYDDGLKQLVRDFANLVKPMVETVDRHGLKKYFRPLGALPGRLTGVGTAGAFQGTVPSIGAVDDSNRCACLQPPRMVSARSVPSLAFGRWLRSGTRARPLRAPCFKGIKRSRRIATWASSDELITCSSSSGLSLDAISSTLRSWSSKTAAMTVSDTPSAAAHRTDSL
jgi:hypothetical protein